MDDRNWEAKNPFLCRLRTEDQETRYSPTVGIWENGEDREEDLSSLQLNNNHNEQIKRLLSRNKIVKSQRMGSGSSLQAGTQMTGEYIPRSNNDITRTNNILRSNTFMSLSHAPVSDSSMHDQPHDVGNEQQSPITGQNGDTSDYFMVKRAPIKSQMLKFKHSTFKGPSASAVTLPRNSFLSSPEKQSYSTLTSLFATSRGRYKFNSDTEDGANALELSKPTTLRQESTKFHQSTSPDIPITELSETEQQRKTALIYGTLRTSSTGGSSGAMTELLQRSKSRVRNSLRNLKFYSRNLSSEEKVPEPPATSEVELLPPSVDFYNPTLQHNEDMTHADTWWSQDNSYTSDSLYGHNDKQVMRKALPVEVPTIEKLSSDSQTEDRTIVTSQYNYKRKVTSQSLTTPDIVTSKSPEQESIEALDDVIAKHTPTTSISLVSNQSFHKKETLEDARELHRTNLTLKGENIEAGLETSVTMEILEAEPRGGRGISTCVTPIVNYSPGMPQTTGIRQEEPLICDTMPQTKAPSLSVAQGMSIHDVLIQNDLSDVVSTPASRDFSSSGSSLPLVASFHSQSSTNIGNDSSEESFVSLERAGDFSDSEDDHQMLTSSNHIRKSGWLVVKHLLVPKRGKLDPAPRRSWQKYWVNLKGGQLLFYDLEKGSIDEDVPKLILPTADAMVQAVPEHAKRDNVSCISTRQGAAYLLQATSQTELDGWAEAIHIEAAMIFTREEEDQPTMNKKTIKCALKHDMKKRKREIEMDEKMKKMADLQMSLVSDVRSRRAITDQIAKWEENLERNHLHVFRFRTYLASLDGDEAPNPRTAMSAVCKSSKQLLSAIKLFNISSLHCLVVSKQLNAANAPGTRNYVPKRKSLTTLVSRSESFNATSGQDLQTSTAGSIASEASPSKSKKFFASLRGFETWRGSTSNMGKKKHQRASVTGLLSAFASGSSPSSHSSLKDGDEKSKKESKKTPSIGRKRNSNSTFYQTLATGEDVTMAMSSDDQSPTPGTISDDDGLRSSNAGSLDSLLLAPPDAWCVPVDWNSSAVRVAVSTSEYVTVTTTSNMTFKQLLEIICQRKQLESNDHFLTSGYWEETSAQHFLLDNDLLSEFNCENLHLRKKWMFSVEMKRLRRDYGFTVFSKVICRPLVVDDITPGGVGERHGLHHCDEILTINGELTSEMSDKEANKHLRKDIIRLLVRTKHQKTFFKSQVWWLANDTGGLQSGNIEQVITEEEKERKRSEHLVAVMEDYLGSIIVPPPPIITRLQPSFIRSPFTSPIKTSLGTKYASAEDIISLLVVPPPVPDTAESAILDSSGAATMDRPGPPPVPDIAESAILDSSEAAAMDRPRPGNSNDPPVGSDLLIDELLKKAEIVTSQCRQVHIMSSTILPPPLSCDPRENQSECSGGSSGSDLQRQISDLEKVKKVLHELVDTETVYVKDLECLLKRFLEPLHSEGFIPCPEIDSLLHSVTGMLEFQKIFLREMSRTFDDQQDESDISSLNRSLISISSIFLQHAAQFKLYAVFSTCHTVAQELFEQAKTTSPHFRAFLEARNPKRQHASTLESYLIKPIQRVLKYPLLLQQLLTLSESLESVSSRARRRLKAALLAMNGVARHINDAQTVHDEFGGHEFEEIMKRVAEEEREEWEIVPSLKMSDLLCYTSTEWLNVFDEVRKLKKGNLMELLLLAFRNAVVLLCRGSKQRDKKKVMTPQSKVTTSQSKVTTPIQENLPRPRVVVSDFVYMKLIPGNELFVADGCPGVKNPHVLELSYFDPKSTSRRNFRLLCESVESRQRVVKTIQYIVKNSAAELLKKEDRDDDVSEEMQAAHDNSDRAVDLDASDDLTTSRDSEEFTQLKKPRSFFYKVEDEATTFPNTSENTSQDGSLVTSGGHMSPSNLKFSTFMTSQEKINKRPERLNIQMKTNSDLSLRMTFKTFKNSHLRSQEFFYSAPSSPVQEIDDANHQPLSPLQVTTSPIKKSDSLKHDCDYGNRSPTRYNLVYGVSPFESKM